ncbi:class F sortase [Nocardioides plantarum]|uniref:Class F sortase n=1 Tax=Nocardioides plantarum TaxID=29299 RepID=A0ABV5K6P8_9ACTN|nr:class F sortase [Nocardioides plantarum]
MAADTPRPSSFDAALSALTTALLIVSVAGVGWGVVAPKSDGPQAAPRATPSQPVRLRVPSLGISAEVVPIKLGSDAVLEPPEDADTVGWWNGSALPGARTGRVVITGHTLSHGKGALDDLVKLRKGGILLSTGTGTRRYQVTDRLVVDYATVAERARTLFGQKDRAPDGARLILVTCTDYNGRVYESNVIIVAKQVPDRPADQRAGATSRRRPPG